MTSDGRFAAVVLAIGFVVAAILHGGIYQLQASHDQTATGFVYRLNRLTGSIAACTVYHCDTAEWAQSSK